MYKNLIVTFFLVVLTGCRKAQTNKSENSLPATEFSKKLDQTKDAQLVDVRTSGEFKNGHLKNAMNIDWNADDFVEKAKTLDKDRSVFVYCMSGPRSTAAAAKLRDMAQPIFKIRFILKNVVWYNKIYFCHFLLKAAIRNEIMLTQPNCPVRAFG